MTTGARVRRYHERERATQEPHEAGRELWPSSGPKGKTTLGSPRPAAKTWCEMAYGILKDSERLRADLDALLYHYERISPEVLDNLTFEERRRFYAMLRLKATLASDVSPEL
jgi:hypothetical protein